SHWARLWGICSLIRIHPNKLANPTSSISDAVVPAELVITETILFQERVRENRNPTSKAYKTATTEASVGVKTPPMMPKRIRKVIINAQNASIKPLPRCFQEALGCLGWLFLMEME